MEPSPNRLAAGGLIAALLVTLLFAFSYVGALHDPHPRRMPIAVIDPVSAAAVRSSGGLFAPRTYDSETAVRAALRRRDVLVALLPPRLLIASAGGYAATQAAVGAFTRVQPKLQRRRRCAASIGRSPWADAVLPRRCAHLRRLHRGDPRDHADRTALPRCSQCNDPCRIARRLLDPCWVPHCDRCRPVDRCGARSRRAGRRNRGPRRLRRSRGDGGLAITAGSRRHLGSDGRVPAVRKSVRGLVPRQLHSGILANHWALASGQRGSVRTAWSRLLRRDRDRCASPCPRPLRRRRRGDHARAGGASRLPCTRARDRDHGGRGMTPAAHAPRLRGDERV